MIKTLEIIFSVLMLIGMIVAGGLNSAISQPTLPSGKPIEKVVNKTPKITKEPDMVWFYGGAANAQDYSMDHNVIAFSMTVGDQAPYSDKQIAKLFGENVFQGEIEAPIAIFINKKKVPGAKGMVSVAYIRGGRFISDYEDKKQTAGEASRMSISELVKYAPEMVNKFNDPKRPVANKDAFDYDPD